jgi:hypothetical protein
MCEFPVCLFLRSIYQIVSRLFVSFWILIDTYEFIVNGRGGHYLATSKSGNDYIN